jgi:ribosomal protein S18 acetylase RimI-like enzyme
MRVEICDAAVDDAPEIQSVHLQTWLSTYPNAEYDITKKDVLDLNITGELRTHLRREYIREVGGHTFVAKADGRIVGFCSLKRESKCNDIHSLYVLQEYQGQGIGKALLKAAIEWFGNTNSVYLCVAIYNYPAQDFYLSQGFRFTGEGSTFASKPGGKTIPSLLMCLQQ